MDDTYIHFVYAQNLAETGRLMFNFAGEPGVGSTSILWVTLLAIGYKLGLSLHITAKVLGITALVLVGQGVYRLLNSKFPALVSLASALMVILSGNMLWFALSGMETLLFLGLGMTVVASTVRNAGYGWDCFWVCSRSPGQRAWCWQGHWALSIFGVIGRSTRAS
ncbi:MAG: hypothetical protein OEZ02_03785 [Anaerolineae bacterium]|nr:hypothetical protein [Anaerolineae bacterium]